MVDHLRPSDFCSERPKIDTCEQIADPIHSCESSMMNWKLLFGMPPQNHRHGDTWRRRAELLIDRQDTEMEPALVEDERCAGVAIVSAVTEHHSDPHSANLA